MNHQIDQLKEEITTKEAALVKEHLEHQRVEKEKDTLKVNNKRVELAALHSIEVILLLEYQCLEKDTHKAYT